MKRKTPKQIVLVALTVTMAATVMTNYVNAANTTQVLDTGQVVQVSLDAEGKQYASTNVLPTITVKDAAGTQVSPGCWAKAPISISIGGSGLARPGTLGYRYSLDGGKTWTVCEADTPFTYSQNRTDGLSILAEAYNTAAPSLGRRASFTLFVDAAAPVLKVEASESGWTKKDVTLSIVGSDQESGLSYSPYTWDGGTTWTSQATRTFHSNTSGIRVGIRDSVGNLRLTVVSIENIDTVEPTFTISGNPEQWQKEDAALTITATDAESGLPAELYSWDGGLTWTDKSAKDIKDNGVLNVWVRDQAGNIAKQKLSVSMLDKTAPVVSVTGNPMTWTPGPAKLVIQAEDTGSGVPVDAYSWDGGKTWTTNSECTVTENGEITAVVRDEVGNQQTVKINVTKVDSIAPEPFTITGSPVEWTNQDVILRASNVSDGQSGLAATAYNWNETGWSSKSSFTVSENGLVTLRVRDAAGNERAATTDVTRIDKVAPVISGVSGVPTVLQNTPANVRVAAYDNESGLHTEAYSFDDGVTWQSDANMFFTTNMAVGLKVRDLAGNVSYQPFAVTNLDTMGPELETYTLALSQDRRLVIVQLVGKDKFTAAEDLEYCFSYDPSTATQEWLKTNQQSCQVGVLVTVACRDELGNVTTKKITPSAVGLAGGTNLPLFLKTNISVAEYALGPVNNAGNGTYLDAAGVRHEYGRYSVGGESVVGLAVEVEAAPLGGGYISGFARLNGNEYPIYWDNANTQTSTNLPGKGQFIIDARTLRNSQKNAALKVVINEYSTEDLDRVINSDKISASIMIDTDAPVVNLFLDPATNHLTITARDTLSGVSSLKYRIENMGGQSVWSDYTEPVLITTSGTVSVVAVDKLNNRNETTSQRLNVAGSISASGGLADGFYYRTSMFDHYLIGTGQQNLG